ncbi:MAG: transglutaminase-like domain-containing protein [Alphaproteobacteria bacterium]|nr:transglutaminase-like domain-containing protein [Alphaproteobacteria bacterium]
MFDFDPLRYLETVGMMPDAEIDLAPSALAMALLAHPGLSIERYFHHLGVLAKEVKAAYVVLLAEGGKPGAQIQLQALRQVISEAHGYQGDVERYDDLQNADLIRVIDRRRGLPISLAILYIHAAKAQGWNVAGLNMPGHFICRIEAEGERLIFDPFFEARVLGAADLRLLVKKNIGPDAELSASYYQPCTNRDILLRLQNNIKFRLIEGEDYQGALDIVQIMKLVSPTDYRLLFDEGVLYAKLEQPKASIAALDQYIKRAPDPADRYDAELLLRQMRESLH